jgi:hypothetical protein
MLQRVLTLLKVQTNGMQKRGGMQTNAAIVYYM